MTIAIVSILPELDARASIDSLCEAICRRSEKLSELEMLLVDVAALVASLPAVEA